MPAGPRLPLRFLKVKRLGEEQLEGIISPGSPVQSRHYHLRNKERTFSEQCSLNANAEIIALPFFIIYKAHDAILMSPIRITL